ncbi:MAG: hypothetical protein HKN25_02770 [Pyrinomonadaceae bacterium]|nr:hypothetical protein [Pyrinomonadaceae bacterium]
MDEERKKILESWSHVLDIPVELSIELGKTVLPLREVLDLSEDSIIMLSRSTGEGVDIRADNRSLASGEIVAMGDKARVRLNELTLEDN